MDNEIWKDMPWYEWLYKISNLWNIINNFTQKTKSQYLGKKRYYKSVSLWKNNVWITKNVHRLVLLAFVWPSKLCVDHINNIKTDNRLKNLEYVTHKENTKRAMQDWLMKNLFIKWHKKRCKKVAQYNLSWEYIKTWNGAIYAQKELNIWPIYWAVTWVKATLVT